MKHRHLALTSLVALLVAACAGSPSASAVPDASSASSAPSPTVVPTQAAAPTLTPDDVKIAAFIKDGYAQWLSFATRVSENSEISEMVGLTKDLHTFIKAQVALSAVYTPSECTEAALGLYKGGMQDAQAAVESMLVWVQGGMEGDIPAEADLASPADDISASVTSLQASLC